MRRGSKEYWYLVNKLSVPTLKNEDIVASTATEKPELFATTFQAKWSIPEIQQNSYTFDFPDSLQHADQLL